MNKLIKLLYIHNRYIRPTTSSNVYHIVIEALNKRLEEQIAYSMTNQLVEDILNKWRRTK